MLSKAMSAISGKKKMSTVDTAWLRMDSDGNLMLIVGVMMLNPGVTVDQFKQVITERLLPYRRFRSRVVHDMAGAWWHPGEVDLDEHIIHKKLDGAAPNKAALQDLVGRLSQQPLDPNKPLWQFHLVDNCVGEDGAVRQALIARIHHCIADGIALIGVMMSMFDTMPNAPARPVPKKAAAAADENPWEQVMLPVTSASVKAIELSATMFVKSLGMMAGADKLPQQLTGLGEIAGGLALDTVKLLAMQDDSRTRLKGKPNGKKHVAWSEPLPLTEVKAIGKAYGCSVNDVLMASVAGALRSYLVRKGDHVGADCELRAMVPVNLRKPSQQQRLGNAFGLAPVVLPVGIEDPVARLHETRARMQALKGSFQPLVAMGVLGVLGAVPKAVQNEIQDYYAAKATAVMSNVPGPQQPLYLVDSRVDQCMFWVPQGGDIGIGISILSYGGGVQFGIVTDDALVQDPEQIISRFAPEFEKLVLLALMDEWA
jgi:WS/DGAT/MGAT family acyltransferase